jgi:hypothetical protein
MIQVANSFRRLEIFNRFGNIILDSAKTPPDLFKKLIHET